MAPVSSTLGFAPVGAPMPRTHTAKMKRLVGIGTAIQGAVLAAVSLEAIPAALRIAEILYAEDFDRAGIVPLWFGPWYLAMWYPSTTATIFFISGAALGIAGFRFAKQNLAVRSLEVALLWAMLFCAGLALALIPLSTMGTDWVSGTRAYDLRFTVIASTVVIWLEVLALLATLVTAKRMRDQFVGRTNTSEA
jgi:hypothetical protein